MQTLIYGLRASGKNTTVDALAEKTGLKSAHLDDLILENIRGTHGRCRDITDFVENRCSGVWYQFRDREHIVLGESLKNPDLGILSLGGGTVAFDRNRHLIDPVDTYLLNPHTDEEAKRGTLERVFNRERHPKKSVRVLLDISLEEQRRRLEEDDKGNKDRPDLGQTLEDTYHDRIKIYRDFADIEIKVDGKTVDEIVDEILGNEQIREAIKKAA